MIQRRAVCCFLGAFASNLGVQSARAQSFLPSGPVNMISGFAPGGGADTAARIVAKRLSEQLGRSVVVQNRAGAGGTIANQFTATAAPDGLTILFGSIGPLVISPHLMKLNYDPQHDLAPLTLAVNFPNVLVVPPQLGVKTLAAYIALARKKPGELTFGSSGIGSSSHLTGEMFNQRAGVKITHVAYKGGSQVLVDLLAGRVSSCFFTPATAIPQIESGALVALATTGLERLPSLPQVPTVAESGMPGFSATDWYAFLAPGKTPEPILAQWNKALTAALDDPDVRKQLSDRGMAPTPGSREALRQFIASESANWAEVIREGHITAE